MSSTSLLFKHDSEIINKNSKKKAWLCKTKFDAVKKPSQKFPRDLWALKYPLFPTWFGSLRVIHYKIMTNILPTSMSLLFVLVLILFMLLTKKFSIVIWWLFSKSQEKNYSLTEPFSKYFLNSGYVRATILNASGNKNVNSTWCLTTRHGRTKKL